MWESCWFLRLWSLRAQRPPRRLNPPPAVKKPLPADEAVSEADPLTYWVGLTFSDEGNQMVVDRIKQFGEEKGIPVEAVVINQNEMVQKLSAAIEAGNLPDGVDVGTGFALLMAQRDLLVPVDDLYAKIGEAQGGWLNAPQTNATHARISAARSMAYPMAQAATCSTGVSMSWMPRIHRSARDLDGVVRDGCGGAESARELWNGLCPFQCR